MKKFEKLLANANLYMNFHHLKKSAKNAESIGNRHLAKAKIKIVSTGEIPSLQSLRKASLMAASTLTEGCSLRMPFTTFCEAAAV